MITACTSLQPPRTAPHCRTALAAFALVTRAVPPQSPVVSPRARPPATCAAPCRAIPARRSLLALGVLGIVSFPPLRGGAGSFTRAPLVGKPGLAMFARAPTAGGGDKPLTELLQTSKEACDAIGAMVRRFYTAINSDTSTLKADKSVFTIADGVVQELLTEYLFAGDGKFRAIVGEEDESKCNIQQRPYTVDTLTVPAEFSDLIDATREVGTALQALTLGRATQPALLCRHKCYNTYTHTHTHTPTHTHTHTHKHTQGLSSQLDLSAEDLATLQEYMAERKQKKQAAGEL